MKITLAAVTAITGLLVADQASAAVVKFKATLNGAQETPAVQTTSAGTADLDFDDAANTLSGSVDATMADGTEVQAAHIHLAVCGKAGSIYKGLTVNTAGFNGTIALDPPIQLDADGVKALNEGGLYINIHTKANPGGEIRGQIYKEGSTETCPSTGGTTDGGTDGGGTSSSGGTTSSSSGGTTPSDAGTTSNSSSSDDGGCSTTGSSSSTNGLVLAGGLGLAFAISAASRRRKRS